MNFATLVELIPEATLFLPFLLQTRPPGLAEADFASLFAAVSSGRSCCAASSRPSFAHDHTTETSVWKPFLRCAIHMGSPEDLNISDLKYSWCSHRR